MTISTRYEARFDAYEWFIMNGNRLIESGLNSTSVDAAIADAHSWLKYARLTGKITD